MVQTKSLFIPLIKTECQISDLYVHQFPELANVTFTSSNIKITTDLYLKEFPIIDTLKNKKYKNLTVDVVIFKGPGELLDPEYNYVMLGDVYEISQKNQISSFKVSFGGMLMEMQADLHLEMMDQIGMGLKMILHQ